jgi:hypothetical protein
MPNDAAGGRAASRPGRLVRQVIEIRQRTLDQGDGEDPRQPRLDKQAIAAGRARQALRISLSRTARSRDPDLMR